MPRSRAGAPALGWIIVTDLLVSEMPPVQRARVNGVELAYWEVGERGDAPPVVLCHGFPEIAFSWRAQLKAFAEAGRWAVAYDARGYGLSSVPAGVAAYTMEALVGDLLALTRHLGAERGIWCGHDWGGLVVWQAALMAREATAGVIGLNTPFLPRGSLDPVSLMRDRLGEDHYIVRFQEGRDSDELFARDVDRTMRFFMRRPGALREGFSGEAAGSGVGGRGLPLQKMLEAYDPARDDAQFLSDAERAVFVRAFARTGFTGGIDWYRNMTGNWERAAALAQRVDAPALMITAELDAALPPALAEPMRAHVADLEMHELKGVGHWSQQEAPGEVNRLMLDWLDRRFPQGRASA